MMSPGRRNLSWCGFMAVLLLLEEQISSCLTVRLGSIEVDKIANMTVYDCDFLHDDIEKLAKANVVATIVDGEEVYKG